MPARALPPDLEPLVEGLSVRTTDHDQPSSVDPNNFRAHITHVSLFVERLLPPSDRKESMQGEVHGEVLWRLTAYRREDVRMICYVTTESDIKHFYDKLLTSHENTYGSVESKGADAGDGDGVDTSMQIVYESEEDVDLPWAVMDLSASIRISVGPKRVSPR